MLAPFPSTVIGILNGALRVAENSRLLSENSPALLKMREGIAAVIAELQPIAALEERTQVLVCKTGPDLYQG